jgi:hypothetical protein
MSDTTKHAVVPYAIEVLADLNGDIRHDEAGVAAAERIQAQGRWNPKWDPDLAALRARLVKVKELRDRLEAYYW